MKNIEHNLFLANYWQQKPIVIRQMFPNFEDFLDEHELAGLAMEQEFDSRIIRREANQWHVSTGPFEEFESHCRGDWTLLVQGIERAIPEASRLLEEFRFLPSWRVDDLMVSYSIAGAGVGPHVDQYDVFIIQGKGTRRWQVGEKKAYDTLLPHPLLKQIQEFNAIIDEVLYPGDVIYIPPGFPHNGVALEPSLNYSVGFRAATQLELLSSFCDYLIENDIKTNRYADPKINQRHYSSEIKPQEAEEFKRLAKDLINSEHFHIWLVQFQSQNGYDDIFPPEQCYTEESICTLINNGTPFIRQDNIRVAHIQSNLDNSLYIGVNGEAFLYHGEHTETLLSLLNLRNWTNNQKIFFKNGSLFVQLVTKLVNEGYWIINQ